MDRAKVIYLEEYRRARQYRSLLEMIEGHLAEAGLLWNGSCVCSSKSQLSEEFWQHQGLEEGAGHNDM
ncbi:hypothetical protein OR1_01478 [Geobacter sp. OR-1]|nr:hypothetical protein OR1_01478 [Geobacter sp. OR-1]